MCDFILILKIIFIVFIIWSTLLWHISVKKCWKGNYSKRANV